MWRGGIIEFPSEEGYARLGVLPTGLKIFHCDQAIVISQPGTEPREMEHARLSSTMYIEIANQNLSS